MDSRHIQDGNPFPRNGVEKFYFTVIWILLTALTEDAFCLLMGHHVLWRKNRGFTDLNYRKL